MFLFHELHVDDDLLEARRDRRTYDQACALVEAILAVPEARGQRVALRLRHHLAQAALRFEGADNALVRWEQRGHEIGAHAHRRHIRTTRDALVAAGVQRLDAVVPGLIRCTRQRAMRLVRACEGLGFTTITDQLQFGSFPYAGRVPWRPARDLRGPGNGPFVFLDVSVNPFAWGLLRADADGVTQQFGLRREHFARLGEELERWRALPSTSPLDYFGYPVHEHNHARGPDTLAPDDASLQAWDDWLARQDVEVVLPRQLVAWSRLVPGPQRSALPSLLHDVPSYLEDRLPVPPPRPRPHQGATGPLRIERVGGERPRLAVVVSHAGTRGGLRERLEPWGTTCAAMPDVAFYFFDRPGDLRPGLPHHADALVKVFEEAGRDGVPVGLLTWSAGLIPALGALDRIAPAFLIDTEGPSDTLSLVPRSDRPDELGHRQQRGPEPWRLAQALRAPYVRLQGTHDHMHGACTVHAQVMVDATGGTLHLVHGRVHESPRALCQLLSEV